MTHLLTTGHRRRLAAMVVAGGLGLSGVTCIVVAVAREEAPQPPLSTVEPPSPASRPAVPAAGAPLVVGPVLPSSEPLALHIPAIGVRSPVQRLGQAADGAMEVPGPGPHRDEVGWYRYSPTPGSLGPAIIVGHLDSTDGPSVFFRLGSLRPRDTVTITRADGSVAIFEVEDVRRYPKAAFPSQLVYGDTNHAALRLITCGGPIGRDSGHHVDNIVVLASLVGVRAAAA